MLAAPTTLDTVLDLQAVEELKAGAPVSVAEAFTDANPAPLVLVVEDNADMNAFIAASLRQRYRVATAGDGRTGLEQALALAPDLILSDVMMPVMTGDEMVAELRRHPEMAGVPIVMLTAKSDEALRMKLLREGVQGYLNKPFGVEELLARVDGLLTERLRGVEQLRASEARFEATFEQAAVGILQMAPDGRFLRVNRRLCEILGYDEAELLARTFRDISHSDDLSTSVARVRQMLAGEIAGFTADKRYLHKDGRTVWGHVSASMVRKTDGTPDYMIAVIEDTSERMAAEEELRRRNEELERFDRASTGREVEMIGLKRQVNELSSRLGLAPPHDLSFLGEAGQGTRHEGDGT